MGENNFKYDKESIDSCFEIAKHEYDHVFERSNKLDNKVNIAITFCGLIFIFITTLIGEFNSFKYPTNSIQLIMVAVYIFFCVGITILYFWVMIRLVYLLMPNELVRIDIENILEKNYYKESCDYLKIFLMTKYSKAIDENNSIIELRFDEYKKCIKIIIIIVITSFVLYFLQGLFK